MPSKVVNLFKKLRQKIWASNQIEKSDLNAIAKLIHDYNNLRQTNKNNKNIILNIIAYELEKKYIKYIC